MPDLWLWAALVLLGAFHGLNPAMGWLFAVALGLQERDRAAVGRALVPIALGHAAAVTAVVAAVVVVRALIDPRALQLGAAVALVGFGAWRLLRGFRHRARVGMRVGFRDLALWSGLMATAHGAGLMVIPALLQLPEAGRHGAGAHAHAAVSSAAAASIGPALAAVAVHTAAMMAVAGAIAIVVFDRAGLGILRAAWVNLDLVWALALLGTGVLLLAL